VCQRGCSHRSTACVPLVIRRRSISLICSAQACDPSTTSLMSGRWEAPSHVGGHAAWILFVCVVTTLPLMVHCFLYYHWMQMRAQQPACLSSQSNPSSCPVSRDLADDEDSDSSDSTSSSHWGTESEPGLERLRSRADRGERRSM